MTEFFLDVTAVVVGIAVYKWIDRRLYLYRHHHRDYNTDPWSNW